MSCPSPLPVLPHVVRKVPVFVNFWMRSLRASATKTFPLPSTATPKGRANCPSPLPELPHVVRKAPVFVNFWMRALSWLATKTFPLPSTATPAGEANCPFPLPGPRSEEHTSELQSRGHLVCRLLLEKKKKTTTKYN